MSGPRTLTDRTIYALSAALSAGIFALERVSPLASDVDHLYVLVILLGLWARARAFPMVAALGVTMLTGLSAVLSPGEESAPTAWIGSAFTGLTFVATAVLIARFRALRSEASANVAQLADFKHALDEAAIVATTDVTGRITYVNDKFCQISGYSRQELLGQDHRIVNSGFHPKEFIRNLWHTIANGRVWHGELRNRAKSGAHYWVDTTIVPFLDARGKPVQYIAIRADVTARKAAEEKLREQASLARVGQMAAVVAHEVRNPLAGIKGAVQILMSRRRTGDGELPVMHDIVERIDSLSDLINDLMVFARPRTPRLETVSLRALAQDAIAMTKRDPAFSALDAECRGQDLPIMADGAMVRAAILNLVLNAAQATGGHGRVTVTLGSVDGLATVEVRDTGPGIPPEIREEVFEPFFTTKVRGGGLGLPTAKRTAELHGGAITLTCPKEGGTAVTLSLLVAAPLSDTVST